MNANRRECGRGLSAAMCLFRTAVAAATCASPAQTLAPPPNGIPIRRHFRSIYIELDAGDPLLLPSQLSTPQPLNFPFQLSVFSFQLSPSTLNRSTPQPLNPSTAQPLNLPLS